VRFAAYGRELIITATGYVLTAGPYGQKGGERMFITIICQECGHTIMQRNIEAVLTRNTEGTWMLISAYCKFCNIYNVYKFKAPE
jgi:ribosomal protein L44E